MLKIKYFHNNKGVSLIIGMAFSIALLASASLITSALLYSQKALRNTEDFNIAFFAAESGIEESLYFNSFHNKGFEAENNDDDNGWADLNVLPTVPNVFYKWNIEGRIDSTICNGDNDQYEKDRCVGIIPFGGSVTFNLGYDDTDKDVVPTSDDGEHASTHSGTKIYFAIGENFNGNLDVDPANDYKPIMTWLASQIFTTKEKRLLFRHNGLPVDGSDPLDCVSNPADADGRIFCQKLLRDNTSYDDNPEDDNTFSFDSSAVFSVENNARGFLEGNMDCLSDPDNLCSRVLSDFFGNGKENKWKKLKFFFISTIEGEELTDPPLDKIYYKIEPASEMTGLRSIITSTGRSRSILSNLEVKIDNTQEFTALDYGILFE